MSTATILAALRADAATCRNCPLWRIGSQTVFGEGPASAKVVLVGEQPGDKEDREGRPFVGPAGSLLRRALSEVGVDPDDVYFTNAVKHFNHELRGKRRLHKTPAQRDIEACREWMRAELAALKPKLIVALGATALRSLLHRKLPVLQNRGKILQFDADEIDMDEWNGSYRILVTVHPSSILRMRSPDRDAAYDAFLRDLSAIKPALKANSRARAGRMPASISAPPH